MKIKGRVVSKGEEVMKGTVIDLVLGDGFGNTKVAVPDLFNLQLDEALFVIKASALNVGAIVFDGTVRDSASAKVYKQFPPYEMINEISQGESIDIFLTQSEKVIKQHNSEVNTESNEDN